MKLIDSEPLITKAELARYLQVHPRTITRMVTANQIPAFKVGQSAIRFRLADVLAALEREEK